MPLLALVTIAGIAITPPAGWFTSTRPLDNVTDPVQRLVLSSYRIQGGSGAVPPSNAVLAQLDEEVPPLFSSDRAWPRRPSRFRLPRLGSLETHAGGRWGEIVFRDRGRHFYVFVWVGRRASATNVRLLLQALDGIRVNP